MDKYTQFINFCLLASFIYEAPNMTAEYRSRWSWIWLALALVGIGIQIFKGATT